MSRKEFLVYIKVVDTCLHKHCSLFLISHIQSPTLTYNMEFITLNEVDIMVYPKYRIGTEKRSRDLICHDNN